MISVSEPLLSEIDAAYVADCVNSGWISSAGTYIGRFEDEWARLCGRRHGIAVSNGTAALQLSVAALDLQPGEKIVMPSFTIISCALAAIYNGCRPVFVDCDPDTWCMDVEQLQDAIDDAVRAVMPVHIYGHPVQMDAVSRAADDHALLVIEDAAQAHGVRYKGESGWQVCGSFGDVSAFSFYANKLVTTGEGGMVLTDDDAVARRLRSLRNLAFGARRFLHEELGYNFRITNMQAALGVAQIERFEEIVEKKRWIGRLYTELLAEVQEVQLPVERNWARSNYWMYGIVLRDNARCDAAEFATRLLERGVESRPFFLGLHEQPALQRFSDRLREFPVTERLSRRGLYVPSGLSLTEQQVRAVALAVKDALAR